MTAENKKRLAEIDALIAELKAEKEAIHPYANLKDFSNKSFGEAWSEPHILARCPSFERIDAKGYDFYSPALGKVEVKSCRLPANTVNQCHPNDCDWFLFALYDCEEDEDYLYLVPSNDFMDLNPSAQHDRGESGCYNMQIWTKARKKILEEKYRISYEELEKRASGKE